MRLDVPSFMLRLRVAFLTLGDVLPPSETYEAVKAARAELGRRRAAHLLRAQGVA